MKLEWLKEVNNLSELLTGDQKIIYDIVGVDAFVQLFDVFQKSTLYFATNLLDPARVAFIKSHSDMSVKEFARKLQVSETYVYRILHNTTSDSNPGLFDEVTESKND